MFPKPSDPVVVKCLSVAKVFHLGKDGPLVGSLPDGHWNRTPNLLLCLHVCLSSTSHGAGGSDSEPGKD